MQVKLCLCLKHHKKYPPLSFLFITLSLIKAPFFIDFNRESYQVLLCIGQVLFYKTIIVGKFLALQILSVDKSQDS